MPSTAATHQTALNAQRLGEQQPPSHDATQVEDLLVEWWRTATASRDQHCAWMQIGNWCHGAHRLARIADMPAAATVFSFANVIAFERAMADMEIA